MQVASPGRGVGPGIVASTSSPVPAMTTHADLKTVDATPQEHYLAQARLQGFGLATLIHTPQTGHPTA
ncbi:hypothetical protein J7J08_09785 [Stenotrophomonas sp. ISL-67]|uniref:hypothetical protein n=1 Tax=Stenotrophomonas sp. ISL-67 TaxID=2819171 RepID=UPI001BECBEC1|nr:hypothetical protein [Stenotrophomonas sp. ISL-67]MBT2767929.1 hypothetical protein [Stenotrophomonas sp. ISL-67]